MFVEKHPRVSKKTSGCFLKKRTMFGVCMLFAKGYILLCMGNHTSFCGKACILFHNSIRPFRKKHGRAGKGSRLRLLLFTSVIHRARRRAQQICSIRSGGWATNSFWKRRKPALVSAPDCGNKFWFRLSACIFLHQ